MSYNFSSEIKSLVDQNMALGGYASEEHLLKAVLQENAVSPKTKEGYRLEELLENCQASQLHGETDFSADVGREVID